MVEPDAFNPRAYKKEIKNLVEIENKEIQGRFKKLKKDELIHYIATLNVYNRYRDGKETMLRSLYKSARSYGITFAITTFVALLMVFILGFYAILM